jgi:hypothetical protein
MNKIILLLVLAMTIIFGCSTSNETANTDNTLSKGELQPGMDTESDGRPTDPILGGDKDEHGCIGSAGYIWCEPLNKCIRPWEEECEEESLETEAKLSPEMCEQAGGYWDECANPCQIDNQGIKDAFCTMECRAMCICGTIAGYSCPPEYKCKMPQGIPDARGYCIQKESNLLE